MMMMILQELIKYAKFGGVIGVLHWIFNAICTRGMMPENFNVARITPLPKKDCIANDPSTYRPIPVSSVYALLYEYLIEKKMFLPTSINQMGFKHKSSM
jgi:hypothetical protein